MPRGRKHRPKAARKSAVTAATYAERAKECQSQRQLRRQRHEQNDFSHGAGENKWPDHRLRRRNSDTELYSNKKNDHFLRRNRSRSPFIRGGAGGGGGCRRSHIDERRRGGGDYPGQGDTSNNKKRKTQKYDHDVRTLYQGDLRSHRYDRIIRDVYIQGNRLKESIKDMLEGLAKLQPDPEEMEWESSNSTYYVSEVPPRAPRAGIEENRVPAVGAEERAGLGGRDGSVGRVELECEGGASCGYILGGGSGLGDVLGLTGMNRRRRMIDSDGADVGGAGRWEGEGFPLREQGRPHILEM